MFGKHHPSSTPEPVRAEGVILSVAPSALSPRSPLRSVTVGIKFDDGQTVRFTQEIEHLVLPPAGDIAARIRSFTQEPIPISLTEGGKIPVCYDPADRTRMWIDEPALHEAAMRRHLEVQLARQARADAILDASDPVPGPQRG